MIKTFFFRYLFSKAAGSLIRTISWIGFLGVTLGITSMVVVLSIMNGLGENTKQRLLAVEPHLIFQSSKQNHTRNPTQNHTQAQQEKLLKALPPDAEGYIFEQQDVLIRTADGFYEGAIAKGMDSAPLKKLLQRITSQSMTPQEPQEPKETQEPQEEDIEIRDDEVFMGMDLARSLGIFQEDQVVVIAPESLLLPPGEIPPFDQVKVIGIINTPMTDSKTISQSIFYKKGKTLAALGQTASLQKGIEVWLDDPDDYKKYLDITDSNFVVESWASRNSHLFYSLKMEKFLIVIFLSLSLLISNFAIITVLILLGTQKRQDMGLLMALGLSPQKTHRLMMSISCGLAGLGICSGLSIGIGLSFLLDHFTLLRLPDIYYDTSLPVKLDFIGITLIMILSVVISLLSAWLPAFLTVEKTPSQALRSKPL